MAELDVVDDVADAAKATLDSVPYEIKLTIVWDDELTWDDLAALRLTCSSLSDAASDRLFYRIVISKLNRDRESFLTICRSPRLARHVREVEWLEVQWDVDFVKRVRRCFERDAIFVDVKKLCRDLRSAAEAAFWLPNTSPGATDDGATEAARQAAVATFQPVFQSAIDGLPGLHTFLSRPMPPARVVTHSGYPLAAGVLRAQQTGVDPRMSPQTNDGLVLFLAPAMARPTSTVTRLRWIDEIPGFSYTRPLPASALACLESVDLRFTLSHLTSPSSIQTLQAACSAATPSLRHLGLSVVHDPNEMYDDEGFTPMVVTSMILGQGLAAAPECALQSLRIVGVRQIADVVMAIRANAKTLRHLHLEAVGATSELFRSIREMGCLALDSVRVVEDGLFYAISECELVRYLSGQPPLVGHADAYSPERLRDWPEGILATTSSGLSNGDPDYDIGDCVCNQICHPRDFADEDRDEDADSIDSGEHRRRAAPWWRWEWCIPPGGNDPNIYYYSGRADECAGGVSNYHPTEIWRFTDRSGDVGYGRDPLTWFEEWDLREGDVEEPTPFSHALLHFLEAGPVPTEDVDSSDDGDSARWRGFREPHEGAVWYDDTADPLVMGALSCDGGD